MTAIAAAVAPAAITVVMLPVGQLVLGLDFRLDEDTADLADLAGSIAELGVLQPLVVRQITDGWEVVAGRRRLSAARIAGLTAVPCILRDLDDDQAADTALAENLHRRDLSPVEIALALKRLRDQGMKQCDIAVRIGRSDATVSALLRLLEIPTNLRDRVHRRELSYSTALDLAGRRSYTKKGGVSTKGAPPPRRIGRERRHALASPTRPAHLRPATHPARTRRRLVAHRGAVDGRAAPRARHEAAPRGRTVIVLNPTCPICGGEATRTKRRAGHGLLCVSGHWTRTKTSTTGGGGS